MPFSKGNSGNPGGTRRTKPFYDESFRGKTTDRFVLLFRKKAE